MASYTTNLNLLKKNPLTEGSDTFNITTMLNDNWDKIDSKIGNPAELWVWEKKTYHPQTYELGEMMTDVFLVRASSNTQTSNFNYADSFDVSELGVVSLDSETLATGTPSYNSYSVANNFVGKYIVPKNTMFWDSRLTQGKLYYIPSDATITRATNVTDAGTSYSYAVAVSKIQEVKGIAAYFDHEGFLCSTAPTAYPEDGQSGDYWYTRLGQMGEGMTKIETGSYVGTGTYGSGNPNSLTFGFVPKLVYVQSMQGDVHLLLALYGTNAMYTTTGNTNYQITFTWSGTTVSWYSSQANSQKNYANYTYNYIAIG